MADEKKIIIDEDWKAQVAAEKAQQQKPSESSDVQTQSPPQDFELPSASWELLLTTLATEAMIALGVVPHPSTGQPVQHRNQAKYLIDVIEMLRDKSKGNLTPDEAQLTENLLHQLRMTYVGIEIPASSGSNP
jgi:hypothetical protein